jgi:hypothetical protein
MEDHNGAVGRINDTTRQEFSIGTAPSDYTLEEYRTQEINSASIIEQEPALAFRN